VPGLGIASGTSLQQQRRWPTQSQTLQVLACCYQGLEFMHMLA
jgi:hypothetical protein